MPSETDDILSDNPSQPDTVEPAEARPAPHFIIGIGASAGGFEALEQFFSAMPGDCGASFVVVQHLSPDHKSLMVELLSKHTPMRVCQAEENAPLIPDTIYLIPPKTVMTAANGRLHLAAREDRPVPNYPIDVFFNSLAENSGEKAVAIILSGTGSDGSRGIRAIKQEGGMVMVQDVDSAKFDGMPRNAIATGLADFVMPPSRMPEELLNYLRHPVVQDTLRSQTGLREDDDRLHQIYLALKQQTGVDFTLYKQSTVLRRVERRLTINHINGLSDYVAYLNQTPEEITALYNDLLIGVTNFFRDPEAFATLTARVLPEIFKERRTTLRIWTTGCSTGEEPYSLAMLVREYMEAVGEIRDVKIFATDIDRNALEFASNGLYPENIATDVSRERLQKFFVHRDDGYQIIKPIREMVIFAAHNIIKDPPFNKIDLLSCRNLLIYLQPTLQQKVMAFFNFALNENGFLFLGSSETVGGFANSFSLVDPKWKLYRSQGKHIPLNLEGFTIAPPQVRIPGKPRLAGMRRREDLESQTLEALFDDLVARYLPPTVVVDENHDVVHVMGEVDRYLKLRPGRTSLDVAALLRQDLVIAVETGLNKASRENTEVFYKDVRLEEAGASLRLDLAIRPFAGPGSGTRLFALTFRESEAPVPDTLAEHFDLDAKARQRIIDLENELKYNRENLQATIEEVETTNEELQATNEELLSANEELQSTNEELQSVNEELITVNAEYQNKIQELTDLNNDVNNLLSSTSIGVLFLDRDLCVRKFTAAAKEEINLMDFDIGRPLSHVSFNFAFDGLVDAADRVLKTLAPFQAEVDSARGRRLFLRILPYVTVDNVIKGVVLTFVDVTGIKQAEAKVRKLSLAVEESPSIVVMTDPAGIIEYVNHAFTRVTGYAASEAVGRRCALLASGETPPEVSRSLWDAVTQGRVWRGKFRNRRKNGEIYSEQACVTPIRDTGEAIVGYLKMAEDISALEDNETALRAERDLIARIADTSPAAITVIAPDGRLTYASRRCEEIFGVARDVLLTRSFDDAAFALKDADGRPVSPDTLPFSLVMAQGAPVTDVRHAIRRPDGSLARLSINAAPMIDASGRITAVVSSIEDITARATADQRCDFMAAVVDSSPDAVVGLDLSGTIISWNRAAIPLYGYEPAEAIGHNVSMLVPEEARSQVQGILARIGRGEDVPPFTARRQRRDGSAFTARLKVIPVVSDTGTVVGATVTVRETAPDDAL
ncbi:Chemotaxis protein methyltransferase CheR [Desulfovibrio sp. DV]|uniref:chemotaxis protein CheB n=1 Tax=Desulfovibrio sp. DV TaxID=1844708 RepID=UPI00094B89FF|nr:chemotaxis protein CheB [Desulfovibrio sp. DV]OLN26463.1 Chemotaxis protein methyltransferase CheR [Desulfovibrio sp. DV]